ncbi:MAG: 4Fe-4S binding protein [Promethearchaeota archaeon]
MIEHKQWSEEELIDFRKKWQAVTIPVNIQMESRQFALDLIRLNQILLKAEKIALGDCNCRKELQNCNMPLKTCIFLNERADLFVKSGRAEFITQTQALSIVSKTHKLGLVKLSMYQSNTNEQFPSEICSCCSCCCKALQGLKLMNMQGLVEPSEFVASFDENTCNKCGVCVDRCQFGARVLDTDNDIVFKQNFCFGCGICVTSCPETSIKLIPR